MTSKLGADFPPAIDNIPYRPCVGIMLLNREGLVWIGKRDDGNGASEYQFSWQMPQGGIDLKEDPREAALRELYEETSIRNVTVLAEAPGWLSYDYPEDVMKTSRKGKYRGQAQKWFAFRFEGHEDEINVLAPPDGHKAEFGAWRWERAENLPELIVPFKRPVYSAVVAAFHHLTA
ncbi:RNA pyrophosphohydrolase [Roseibium sp. RKSG952]|uniref:RNA pyrophosphohydrolase n=1 Tax=Roseibium sp. RKSG952 TaxID=2529384 RepID=UPI0012BCE427|nr:RNA pyrophosphohydrolase [Roseibium sp. RKSG952]MTH96358.1 RNA pyrophosphohydrolase [Roseibium sp. RKSG952]